MTFKDHLPNPEETARKQRRDLKRVTTISYQASPPVITRNLDSIGQLAKTIGEVKDIAFPALPDINDLTDNVQTVIVGAQATIQMALDNAETHFQRVKLDDNAGAITSFIVNFVGLAKNKALEFIADFETVFAGLPTIDFQANGLPITLAGLPAAFGDTGTNKFKLQISAIDTPVIESYEVLNGASAGTGGGDVFLAATQTFTGVNTFSALTNFDGGIQIRDSVSATHGLLQGLAGIGVRLTLTSGEKFQLFDNITNIYEMTNAFGADFKQHDLFGVTGLDFDGVAPTIQGLANIDFLQASHSINSLAGSILYQVDSTDFHGFFAGGVEIARFQDIATVLSLDMKDHLIGNIKHTTYDVAATLAFSGAVPAIGYDSVTSRFIFNLPVGANLFVTNNNVIGSTQMNNNSMSSNLVTGNDLLQVGVNATVPTVVGEFRNDGTDVTVFTGGVVKSLSDIGTGSSGANTSLSNLITTNINQDMLPNQATGGNLGSTAVGKEWFNLFSRRVTFPVATSIGATDYSFGRVASPNRVQYNVPTGAIHRWTINGSTEISLSNLALTLSGVDLDMENNSIFDVNQIQITGSTGDTIRGFLGGTAGLFDITANENNSKVRIFGRNAGGTLVNLVEADASSGLVIFGNGSIGFGSVTNRPTITRSGDDLNYNVGSAAQINLQVGAVDIINITSADININKDLDLNNNVTVDWASTQSTVGAAGGATAPPATPTGYLIIKVNGTERVVPFYAKI